MNSADAAYLPDLIGEHEHRAGMMVPEEIGSEAQEQ